MNPTRIPLDGGGVTYMGRPANVTFNDSLHVVLRSARFGYNK